MKKPGTTVVLLVTGGLIGAAVAASKARPETSAQSSTDTDQDE